MDLTTVCQATGASPEIVESADLREGVIENLKQERSVLLHERRATRDPEEKQFIQRELDDLQRWLVQLETV